MKSVHSRYKRTIDTPSCIELNIGDLYSEEQRDIVLEITVPQLQSAIDSQEVAKFKLTYFDVFKVCTETLEASAIVTRTENEVMNIRTNIQLDKQRNRVETVEALQRGRELADKSDLENARKVLKEISTKMQNSVSTQDPLVQSLQNDIREVLDGMKDNYNYLKIGSKLINSSNNYQRSNKFTSQFQTNSKSCMKSMFSSIK